jgi:ribose transport system permease protein
MVTTHIRTALARFLSDYGMLLVLLLLCGYYSAVTVNEQQPIGRVAGEQLANRIIHRTDAGSRVLIIAGTSPSDRAFSESLGDCLHQSNVVVVGIVTGQPSDARHKLQQLADAKTPLDVLACTRTTAGWDVYASFLPRFDATILVPESYRWPDFLKAENLLNVAHQISVIAIVAIGMTMVVITAGIDLSVGSLIALSAVVSTLLIRDVAGADQASALAMTLCCAAAIFVCALLGACSGVLVTALAMPPFIVTLGMMLVASGLAYILATGQSIYQVPDSFIWLGRGADFLHIPNAVVMMILLYSVGHVVMTRMTLGRYVYAVGGNREAARLSGVPVRRVLLFVYTLCGALAGLGGVVMASQLKSGAPTYGLMYELYCIAAVVVGGTSLAGGEGKILGTLIGAFIIAVIQNGMNLTGVESYTQKVVLGLVILGAVLLDMLKKRWWDRGKLHSG